MKKHKNSNRSQKHKSKKEPVSSASADKNRRRFLGLARNGAIGVLAVGGLGLFFVQRVRSSIREHDLSRVGNGTPTVVQVHDPECSLCLALQRETRQALHQFEDGELDYVVANIKSSDGRNFANQYRVPHVTLLLFDADGAHKGTLRGQRQSEELETAFRSLLVD